MVNYNLNKVFFFSFSRSDRLILLNKLLEDGNTLYRRNRFEDAAHRYQYAVKRLPPSPQQQLGRQLSQQEEQLFEQLRIHLLLNLSRCKRKMGDLAGAAETAGQVKHPQIPKN